MAGFPASRLLPGGAATGCILHPMERDLLPPLAVGILGLDEAPAWSGAAVS